MFLSNYLPAYHVVLEAKKTPRIKMVNQYLLISKIGTGYFSKVYLALYKEENENDVNGEPKNKSYYAAKAIHVHERYLTSSLLQREIQILRSFDHPNIIKLHTVLYAPSTDIAYIIMEWANSGTLQQAINNNIIFDEKTIASIFMQISLAVSYIHSKGIVHRDIKPSNILLFSDGTAKLSDFGISHSDESAESVAGTPAYQAPDLFDDDSDLSSKCYSENSSFENSGSYIQIADSNDSAKLAQKKEYRQRFINKKSNENNVSFNEQGAKAKNMSSLFNRQKTCQNIDHVTEKEKKKNDPKKSDVWSLGISLFQTAFGTLPYKGQNIYEIINHIKTSPLIIPQNNGRNYSPLFIDLIVKMLKKKSSERISIEEVVQHPFFIRYQIDLSEKKIESDPNYIIISHKKVMQKIKFDFKPFQPPDQIVSQVVKIEAITCPDNYSFAFDQKTASCSSYRFSYID